MGLGSAGAAQGVIFFFFEHGRVAHQIDGGGEQNRMPH